MRKLSYIIIYIILLYLNGCLPSRSVVPDIKSPDYFKILFQQRIRDFKTFYGAGTLTVESPEFTGSSRFQVSIKYPDSLLLELRGIFGISIANILITDSSFIFLDQRNNNIIIGTLEDISKFPYLNLHLNFKDVIDIFSGMYFYTFLDFDNSILNEDNDFLLKYTNEKNIVKKMWIDSQKLYVKKIQETNDSSKDILTGYTDSYDSKNKFPNWIRILLHNPAQSITIAYDYIKLNEELDLTLPGLTLKR